MGSFNETGAPARKYLAEQGIVITNCSKIFQTFWLHSSIFALEKQPKNFRVFPPLPDPLVATFNEIYVTTFRKYVAEEGITLPNCSKTFQTFSSHSFLFTLEKQYKSLNFQSNFTSKRPFDSYLQRNACTYLQKIDSSTTYSDGTLIKNISN